MNSTYELIVRQSKYKYMRENVIKMINVLSNNLLDNLDVTQASLKDYYLVNDVPCKYEQVCDQKVKIKDSIYSLRIILNSIDAKIASIKENIREIETEGTE